VSTATPDHSDAKRPTRGLERIRERLPEILIEAGSVLLAVLLAFAVDEWRDTRAKRELAARAEHGVLAELKANRDELRSTFEKNAANLAAMQRTLDHFAADPDVKSASVSLGFSVSELSSAAWDTTRTTQAAQLLPFDWVVDVARVYETQALYKAAQLDMLERTRTAAAEFSTAPDPPRIVGPLHSQLDTFQSLGQQLLQRYDEVLSRPPP